MDLDNSQPDLESVIEDSLNDATATDIPDEPVESTDTETPVEDAPAAEAENQVAAPAADAPTEGEDDFSKRFGVQANSVTGRENRIPYSRVKKIVAKAEKDAETRLRKELETSTTPKFTELETKVKDYEGRLERVAQFEQILEQQPREFLGMLAKHPAYKEFFEFVERAAQQGQTAEAPTQAPVSDMPQPDQKLEDGSMVYSMEGLQKLLEWQSSQVEQRTIKQVEQRYKPIEQQWQADQEYQKMVPVVEKQIAEARTWDGFNELEPKILDILKTDKTISLERAYMKAYQAHVAEEREKLTTDHNKVRTSVLAEIKKKPTASAAPSGGVKPTSKTQPTGPRSIEDIINDSLEEAGLKQR